MNRGMKYEIAHIIAEKRFDFLYFFYTLCSIFFIGFYYGATNFRRWLL